MNPAKKPYRIEILFGVFEFFKVPAQMQHSRPRGLSEQRHRAQGPFRSSRPGQSVLQVRGHGPSTFPVKSATKHKYPCQKENKRENTTLNAQQLVLSEGINLDRVECAYIPPTIVPSIGPATT